MEHEFDEELFIFGLGRIETVVVHSGAKMSQLNEMLCHIRGQHCLDHDMSHSFEVFAIHLDGPITLLILAHEVEGGSQMVILQNAHIIVSDSYLIIHQDEEGIVDTGVLVVMQRGRHQTAHHLQVIHLQLLFHATLCSIVVEGLTDISCVGLVVICDLLVACGEIPDEADQPREINVAFREESILGEQVRQYRDKLISVGCQSEIEDVEIVLIYLFQFLARLWRQLEEAFHEHDAHFLAQLREDRLRLASLGLVLHTVVLEASSLLLSKLRVPGPHALLAIELDSGCPRRVTGLPVSIAGNRLTVILREYLFIVVIIEIEILLVQLVVGDHLDAVLQSNIGAGVVVDSLLHRAQLLDNFLAHGYHAHVHLVHRGFEQCIHIALTVGAAFVLLSAEKGQLRT